MIAAKLLEFYGENIIKLEAKPFWEIFVDSFFTPLNVYEIILIPINYFTDAIAYIVLLIIYITG